VLPHLIAHVAAFGCDASPIRRLPGLWGRDLDDPDARIPDAAAIEAWRLAERITGDAVLGLHMAQAIPAGALDLLEYAFRSSPTFGSGLMQLARYSHVVGERTEARLSIDGDTVAINWSRLGERQRIEFAIGFLIRIAREATGTSFAPMEVHLAHNPPESLFEHRAFYRAPVLFNEPVNQILFSRSDLTRPFRTADPALLGVVCRRLEKMRTQIPAQDNSMAALVRRVLFENLAHGEPTARATARELNVSERTLHRRLRAEHASFRHVLDTLRCELASSLLREPSVGIPEVAFLLGYSEPAAFYRSFRRWTGQTPLAFRRAFRNE
jgi:AraC-like DNA-binding protein